MENKPTVNNTIEVLEKEIQRIDNKEFKLYFYTFDTKGTPSGSLYYLYDLALQMKELGYDVRMLHSDKDFVGVGSWMGEEYSSLPHYNIEKDTVTLNVCDIVFIPEINANTMVSLKGKNITSRKVAVLTNFGYLADIMRPIGTTWSDLEVHDCVTPSENLADRIKEVFPDVRVEVVKPRINKMFTEPDGPKPLTVNIIAKNSGDANAIINPLQWKFKQYGFTPVRELRGLPMSELNKAFQTSFLTVWLDTPTEFGYSALQAMACGNIIIGKVPENIPDWMLDENGDLANNGVWFYNTRDAHVRIADIVETYMNEAIPDFIYDNMKATVSKYSDEASKSDINRVIVEKYINGRKKELTVLASGIKNNMSKNENE